MNRLIPSILNHYSYTMNCQVRTQEHTCARSSDLSTQSKSHVWKDGLRRSLGATECEDLCCIYAWGLPAEKCERPQLGPHNTSLGLHQGNKFWCVVFKFVHEALLQGNCSYSPEFLLDLNLKQFTSTTSGTGPIILQNEGRVKSVNGFKPCRY